MSGTVLFMMIVPIPKVRQINPSQNTTAAAQRDSIAHLKQECIPVGCVPPAAVVVVGWGWVWSWSPWISPLGVGLDLIPLNFSLAVGLDLIPLNFSLGCGPGPDPPQFPPWVWAWGVSLEGVSLEGGGLLGRKGGLLGRKGGLLGRKGGLLAGRGGSLAGRGVSLAGRGVSLAGGLPGRGEGVSLVGAVSQHALRQTPLLTEWQMPVKI